MKRRGFRLWIVLSAIFVPAVAFWQVDDLIKTWAALDQASVHMCVEQEGKPNFDVDKCFREAGAGQTAFQHEHTTPGAYWGFALALGLTLDLILTGVILAAFFVGRWVVRGFAGEPK